LLAEVVARDVESQSNDVEEHLDWRSRAKSSLERYFRRRSFPRVILTLVLLLTGGGGFMLSYGMLAAGVNHMWIRYPIAVLGSYGILLALVRLWAAVEHARFDADDAAAGDDERLDEPLSLRTPLSRDSWLNWLDISNVGIDLFDEGCLPALAAAVLTGVLLVLIAAVATLVAMAPTLIAEVFLDVFIVTALYRRLRAAQKEHWLGTALRKTWAPMLATAVALTLAGWTLEAIAPGAPSIGKAIRQIQTGGIAPPP
jgi:hypothetical protein